MIRSLTKADAAAVCIGKQALTAVQAREIMRRAGSSKSRDKGRVAYRCQFCNAWHLGKAPPKALR